MLENIFKPFRIGNMELKNRLVVAPMVTNYCTTEGIVTDRYISYHEEKAKGGWGLIITEDYAIDPQGKGFPYIPGLWNDEQLERNIKLTERVHRYSCRIMAQIYHSGRQTRPDVIGTQPVAPSRVVCPGTRSMPRELSIDEIKKIVRQFGDSALMAKKAGFDGVEVHGAHGYLIAQFLSQYSNKRCDEYGGNLFNRLRFPREIISCIREKTGKDFPVSFRISADEFVPGGRTIEDTKAICRFLEESGVDTFHISAGVYGSWYTIVPPYQVRHGWLADYAEEVKKVVDVPVIVVGRINDPFLADSIIASKKADFVAMGRASLADPDLPNKAMAGDFDDIIHCTGCMQGCAENCNAYRPIQCVLNPRLGKEEELKIVPALTKKKVFVIGGGPGGMEAAAVCAKRGHEVHLFESSDELGGQFRISSIPPGKGEIASFIFWQKRQLKKSGVFVYLNTEISEQMVEDAKPDAVIVATGSKPALPDIPGIRNENVFFARDVLSGSAETGKRVAVIGGGMVGTETALHLSSHGKEVIIIEMLPEIARDEPRDVKLYQMEEIKKYGISMLVNSSVVSIGDDCCIFIENGGERKNIGCFDTIVIAIGQRSENKLAASLKGKINQLIVVGDALKVRKALEAIEEGYMAGLKI